MIRCPAPDAPTLTAGATCACGPCAGLDLAGLGLAYGARWAFRRVDLAIPACAVTALVGPSGSGKPSLLSCLNRLHLLAGARQEGTVRLAGEDTAGLDLAVLRRRVGMIFQRPNPFPMSVRANLALPLREHGCRDRAERDGRIERALRSVGLWAEVRDRLDGPALALSGGQQQRLCLARALVLEPRVLLLDEPCSALDPFAAGVVEDLIAGLRGFYTVVLVSHDLAQARRLADRIALLWPGAEGGRLAAAGPADLRTGDPVLDAYLDGRRLPV